MTDTNLNISFGSISDSGKVKEYNTDAILEFPILSGHIFTVCDGHDGDNGHGALAAKLTAESIKKYFHNRSYKDIVRALTNAVTFANYSLYEQIQKNSKYKGMSSTLAIVIYRNNKIYYAYAGDSRIYHLKNNKLQLLTRDHVTNYQNPKGEDVKILIGKNKDLRFGVCRKPLDVSEDDLFMVCSDGITDYITNDEIEKILKEEEKSPEHKCKDLVDLANEKGGNDCISVQIIEFSQPLVEEKKILNFNFKSILYVLAAIIIVAGLAFAGVKGYNIYLTKEATSKNVVINKKEKKQQNIISQKQSVVSNKSGKNKNKQIIKAKQKETVKPKQKTTDIQKTTTTKISDNSNIIYFNHKIKYGDNLYRLGLRYNVSQQKLIDINGDKAKKLIAGSIIKIPVKAIHKVKAGESFSTISDKYNIKIKHICFASGIKPGSQLKKGQVLVIPLK
jgi:protein phosphatase